MTNHALAAELQAKAEKIIELSVTRRIEQETALLPTMELPDEAAIKQEHEQFGIASLFVPFSERDPSALAEMADHLQIAADLIKSKSTTDDSSSGEESSDSEEGSPDDVKGMMDSVHNHIDSYWDGHGATNFKDKFIQPFQGRISRQCELIFELHTALKASEEILKATQRDIVMIADRAIVSLGGEVPKGSVIVDRTADLNVLSVVGTFLAVLAAIPTGGLSGFGATASMGLALTSTSMQFADATSNIKGADQGTGADAGILNDGAHATHVLDSVVKAIYKLQAAANDEELQLMEALRRDADYLSLNTYRELIPPPPMILDNQTTEFFDDNGPR
ncbi:hypothetical protein FB566_2528 [Stackebrandtia endophytica]|uniref:Uncharacterized protein n=1 Tax=Stackebrandtia endophytica TaxID=1496996 RepID=A0A543AWQ0_9ACTN|nr:hypothetical protein [Stackebrandtia endophytica]TQL76984.1 hypothetical protein FB566_2528 [Stackebrandtia endophytica]